MVLKMPGSLLMKSTGTPAYRFPSRGRTGDKWIHECKRKLHVSDDLESLVIRLHTRQDIQPSISSVDHSCFTEHQIGINWRLPYLPTWLLVKYAYGKLKCIILNYYICGGMLWSLCELHFNIQYCSKDTTIFFIKTWTRLNVTKHFI